MRERQEDAKAERQEARKENLSLPKLLRSVDVKTREKTTTTRPRPFPAKKHVADLVTASRRESTHGEEERARVGRN